MRAPVEITPRSMMVAAEIERGLVPDWRPAFAEALGTSASRLSTYAPGTVVPSATMLMRIEHLAAG